MSNIILSIHQLNEYVRILLGRDPLLQRVKVRGEISNFKLHSSGHMYFTLKDEQDKIHCVFFRQNNMGLKFRPADGMQVIASGTVSLFGRDGQYQLYIDSMERDGLGDLHIAFEKLKNRLREEGLFNPEFKKPLPLIPKKVAVITSHTGAAVRDIIKIIRRRNKNVDVLVIPVAVQGPEAHLQIAAAIRYANTRTDIDLIITGRGGGSIEELWAFNEETVARAIFDSDIPVISAVGHETDFTIADFAADVRAATPSAAAEIAVPETIHMISEAAGLQKRLADAMAGYLSQKQHQLEILKNHYVFRTPRLMIDQHSQYLDQLAQRLFHAVNTGLRQKSDLLSRTAASLNALSPLSVLARGYTITMPVNSDRPVASAAALHEDERLTILFRDGQAGCIVNNIVLGTIDKQK